MTNDPKNHDCFDARFREEKAVDDPGFASDTARRETRPPGRTRLVVTLIGLGWVILSIRLVQLQWWQQDKFVGKAEQQREFVEEVVARPGDIVDRQGRLLATTLTARSLYLIPAKISEPQMFAEALAEPLGLSSDSVYEKVVANSERQFVWIKRRLTETERRTPRPTTTSPS